MTEPLYSERHFGAFLFDMDGTILSSIAATERVWAAWARRHRLDVESFLPTVHGRRPIETISCLELDGIDIERELEALLLAELEDVEGIEPITGARAFLHSLPTDRWAVVTSAPRQVAARRLEAAGLPMPPLLISADDVRTGKPAPDCFILGAERLGQAPEACLVFEDTVAGIQAAEAAGAAVIVINALHKYLLETGHPSIPGYERLTAQVNLNGLLQICLNQ
jgi:mannitol-1-/sugar-/sorbitol-6-phosphatase